MAEPSSRKPVSTQRVSKDGKMMKIRLLPTRFAADPEEASGGGIPIEQLPFPTLDEADRREEDTLILKKMPMRPLSRRFRLFFVLASIVTGLCNVTIKQLLLPAQVAYLAPTNKFTVLALIAAVGACAGVIASPLAGAFSDRTTLPWGRRRPWIALGIVFAVLGLITMAQAATVVHLLVGEVIVQLAVDTMLSAITAIIPDQVPPQQRATASAFIGMSPIVGGLVGLLLIARFVDINHHAQNGYYLLALLSCLLVTPFLFVLREGPTRVKLPPLRFKAFLASFWIDPRKYPDFGYTLLSRCLIFLGYTILISYLLYYLQDVTHYPGADKGVAIFQLVSTIALVLAAVGGGILADKLQRLKPFICGAALLMGCALLLIALSPGWPLLLLAAVMLGLGFGVYLAVDIALAVRVLPDASHGGKDLGIINTAIFIPLIISPILGAVVLNTFHSYALLFSIAAVAVWLAGLSILPVKQVR